MILVSTAVTVTTLVPQTVNSRVTYRINGTCFRCKHGWTGVYCNTSKMTNQILGHFKYLCFVMIQLIKKFNKALF